MQSHKEKEAVVSLWPLSQFEWISPNDTTPGHGEPDLKPWRNIIGGKD